MPGARMRRVNEAVREEISESKLNTFFEVIQKINKMVEKNNIYEKKIKLFVFDHTKYFIILHFKRSCIKNSFFVIRFITSSIKES